MGDVGGIRSHEEERFRFSEEEKEKDLGQLARDRKGWCRKGIP